MGKRLFQKMSDAIYLDRAANWAKDLTRMKARGPGDTENAMRSIAREYGVSYRFLWSLRYRRDQLKIISISVYESIRAAHSAECEKQLKRLENELKTTKEVAGADSFAVRTAAAVAGPFLGKDP